MTRFKLQVRANLFVRAPSSDAKKSSFWRYEYRSIFMQFIRLPNSKLLQHATPFAQCCESAESLGRRPGTTRWRLRPLYRRIRSSHRRQRRMCFRQQRSSSWGFEKHEERTLNCVTVLHSLFPEVGRSSKRHLAGRLSNRIDLPVRTRAPPLPRLSNQTEDWP